MKLMFVIVAAVMLAACGGSRTGVKAPPTTLEVGSATDCAGACDRVARCWQKQYGQDDATGDRAECMKTCTSKPAPDQEAYAKAVSAETSCVAILDM